jgi:predicted ArsR family transcriptional regulator
VETVKKGEGQRSRGPESPRSLGPRGGSPDRRLSAASAELLEKLRAHERPMTLASLAALTRTSEHPSIDAELAGEEWGHGLAQRRGAAPTTPESARDHAVELFDDFGFEPQRAPESPSLVRLTRCPLLEAARTNPAIVCSVHLGMLRGVLDEYGANPKEGALVPFAEPGACRVVIPPVDDLS